MKLKCTEARSTKIDSSKLLYFFILVNNRLLGPLQTRMNLYRKGSNKRSLSDKRLVSNKRPARKGNGNGIIFGSLNVLRLLHAKKLEELLHNKRVLFVCFFVLFCFVFFVFFCFFVFFVFLFFCHKLQTNCSRQDFAHTVHSSLPRNEVVTVYA